MIFLIFIIPLILSSCVGVFHVQRKRCILVAHAECQQCLSEHHCYFLRFSFLHILSGIAIADKTHVYTLTELWTKFFCLIKNWYTFTIWEMQTMERRVPFFCVNFYTFCCLRTTQLEPFTIFFLLVGKFDSKKKISGIISSGVLFLFHPVFFLFFNEDPVPQLDLNIWMFCFCPVTRSINVL